MATIKINGYQVFIVAFVLLLCAGFVYIDKISATDFMPVVYAVLGYYLGNYRAATVRKGELNAGPLTIEEGGPDGEMD